VKRLSFLMLRSYLLPLLLVFAITVFMLVMQFVWKYIDDLVGKGLDIKIILELLVYATSYVIPNALPLSILIASLMAFGNLGERYELIALKSSGISLSLIMRPLIAVTIVISLTAFAYSNFVLPITNLKLGTLLWDIRNQRPELNLEAGTFNNDISNYTIKVGEKNRKTNMMYNFMIYDHSEYDGNRTFTSADSASMVMTKDEKHLVIKLFNGTRYEETKTTKERGKNGLNRFNFAEQTIILDMSGFEFKRTNEELFRQDYRGKDLKELKYSIDSLTDLLSEKKQSFIISFIHSNIVHGDVENYYFPDSLTKVPDIDTLSSKYFVNTDSIFANINEYKKMRITAMAYSAAKTCQTRVQSSNKEFYYQNSFLNKHKAEWHNKLSLAFACFIFFFVGAPLGAIIRKGGLALPVVVSALIFVAYYMISLVGKKLVIEDLLPSFAGMWLASAIIFALGLYLSFIAAHDSVLLNTETYINKFKKILRIN